MSDRPKIVVIRCTCILGRAAKVAVRDPWCKACEGEPDVLHPGSRPA